MRCLGKMILVTLLILTASCAGTSKQIDLKMRQQQTKGTCWMASLRMAIETYKDVEVQECELMNALNDRYGPPPSEIDCCIPQPLTIKVPLSVLLQMAENSPEGKQAFADAVKDTNPPAPNTEPIIEIPNFPYLISCQRGGDRSDIFLTLDYVAHLRYRVFTRPMEWSEVKASIDRGFMIISWISQPLYEYGHLHVIKGYAEQKGVRYLIIAETTMGMEQWVKYEEYLGSSQSIWEMAIVITEEPSKTKLCNWVFGDYICFSNPKTETLMDKIESFFKELLS